MKLKFNRSISTSKEGVCSIKHHSTSNTVTLYFDANGENTGDEICLDVSELDDLISLLISVVDTKDIEKDIKNLDEGISEHAHMLNLYNKNKNGVDNDFADYQTVAEAGIALNRIKKMLNL